MNRKEIPLTEELKEAIMAHTNLIEIENPFSNSSRKIRQAYANGKDISQMVSESTWEIIKDHIHIFKN